MTSGLDVLVLVVRSLNLRPLYRSRGSGISGISESRKEPKDRVGNNPHTVSECLPGALSDQYGGWQIVPRLDDSGRVERGDDGSPVCFRDNGVGPLRNGATGRTSCPGLPRRWPVGDEYARMPGPRSGP